MHKRGKTVAGEATAQFEWKTRLSFVSFAGVCGGAIVSEGVSFTEQKLVVL